MKLLRYLIVVLFLVVTAAYLCLRLTTPARSGSELGALEPAGQPSGLLSTGISHNSLPTPTPAGGLGKLADPSLAGNVSRDAIEQFVNASGRSAASLLAAWSESRDRMWLREAAEKYPNDPAVAYLVLMADVFPAQRAAWLERLRTAAPQNGLADFLEAGDRLASGDHDTALARLRDAVAKPAFNDYSLEVMDVREALMRASFRNPVEAGMRAMSGVPLESVPLIFKAADEVLAGQRAALQQNDPDAAHAATLLSIQIGRVLNNPETPEFLIHQLAGMSIEERALIAISSTPGAATALGFNPEDRIAQLQSERDEIKALSALLAPTFLDRVAPTLPEYLQHVRAEGELAALRWLRGKMSKQ